MDFEVEHVDITSSTVQNGRCLFELTIGEKKGEIYFTFWELGSVNTHRTRILLMSCVPTGIFGGNEWRVWTHSPLENCIFGFAKNYTDTIYGCRRRVPETPIVLGVRIVDPVTGALLLAPLVWP